MTLISQRLLSVKPSPTLAATQRASELKAQGKEIFSLSAGEPDFNTPDWICQGAINSMSRGETKYTAVGGTPILKQAIVDKFKNENDLTYRSQEVMASTGGKQVIFNALLATLNPGDEVIIPAPYWVSYVDMVTIAGGTSVTVPCPEHQNFKMSPAQLDAAITPQTKWLILNSPSNPTGAVYSKQELLALAEVLMAHPHVYILSDDIYEHILFTQDRFWTLAQVEPRLKNRTLTMNGVAKSYAMTGWRLGYAGGPEHLIKAMTDLQSHSTSNPSSISQGAVVAALKGPQDFLKEWRHIFQKRRDLMLEGLHSIPGIRCTKPEGAFYLYPSCEELMGKTTPEGEILSNDEDVCRYLLESQGLSVVQGSAFGLSPHFRISYATDEATLKESCRRLAIAVKVLR
ncbi:MAG: pyridoxal phosphate-dependent aminotransferase [Janthinobacterium lividum]